MFSAPIWLHNHPALQFNNPTVTRDLMTHGITVEHVPDAQQQFAQMKRLGNKLLGANLETFQTMLGGAQRRHEHYRYRRGFFNVARQLKACSVRQTDVENNQVPKSLMQF